MCEAVVPHSEPHRREGRQKSPSQQHRPAVIETNRWFWGEGGWGMCFVFCSESDRFCEVSLSGRGASSMSPPIRRHSSPRPTVPLALEAHYGPALCDLPGEDTEQAHGDNQDGAATTQDGPGILPAGRTPQAPLSSPSNSCSHRERERVVIFHFPSLGDSEESKICSRLVLLLLSFLLLSSTD